MMVQQFLQSLKAAPAAERAEIVMALADAWLHAQLAPDEADAIELAMTVTLDDPCPAVRLALAEAVAAAEEAPRHVVVTLAQDQPDIAVVIAHRSPLLLDAELVDLVGGGCERLRRAVATRAQVSRAVAAAVAEVAEATACLYLIENPGAEIAPMTLKRLVERHGHDPEIREALMRRPDLPLSLRQVLIEQLGHALSELVVGRAWLGAERAAEAAREACERATLRLAGEGCEPRGGNEPGDAELAALARDLRARGQLTPALLLRAACLGAMPFLETALAELTGLPRRRVATLVRGGRNSGLRALCDRAGLPRLTFPAFAAAAELHGRTQRGNRRTPSRRMIEAIVARCEAEGADDRLLVLLRRFAAEAAREEARDTCMAA